MVELQILDWIQLNMRTPLLDRLMTGLTLLGNLGLLWIAIAVLCLLVKPHRRCGVSMGIGLAAGAVIGNLILKNLVARPRPCWINPAVTLLIQNPVDYSFPSGHTLSGFVAATVLFRHDKRLGIPAYCLASAIAFSRLYLYVHYPSDVLAGIVLGVAIGILADRIVKRVAGAHVSRREKA